MMTWQDGLEQPFPLLVKKSDKKFHWGLNQWNN